MTPSSADLVEQVHRFLLQSGHAVNFPILREPSLLLASHESQPLFSIKVYPGVLRLNTAYRLSAHVQSNRLHTLEVINEYNRTGIGVSACLNQAGEIAVEAWYYAPFEPGLFAEFLRRVWFRELARLAQDPGIRTLELQPADASATSYNQRR